MGEGTAPTAERRPPLLPVLTSVGGHWRRSLFGIVPPGAVRRRPSDVVRLVGTALVVGVAATRADAAGPVESAVVDLLGALPGGLEDVARAFYAAGPVVALVIVVAALLTRRWRLLLSLLGAGGLAWALAVGLDAVVDVPALSAAVGRLDAGHELAFPVVPLAASAAVLLVGRPFLTRPARRLVEAVYWLAAVGALYLVAGLPSGIVASLVLGWGCAALAHLAFGSPAGVPSPEQVAESLADLGVAVGDLRLDPEQTWGLATFVGPPAQGDGPPVTVEVVGRDSTDARLFHKLWRFVWYKDSGPVLTLRRSAQVEHQALVLLLAARTEARVPDLLAVGMAGARDDALIAVVDPPGRTLDEVEPARVTDAVLDGAWADLGALHDAGIAHGNVTARRVVVADDGTTGLVRFDRAEASAPPDRRALDAVQLLVTTAVVVGAGRAVAAARRALGDEALEDLLPYLEPAAVTGRSRGQVSDLKDLMAELRDAATTDLGVEVPPFAELRRFSAAKVLLAAAFAFGVYLLVAQLAGVASMGDVFAGAAVGWVVGTALLAQLPPPAQAVAMTGSVAAALPLRIVAVVQYAQAFTGLVGGTAGNATLSIRFFQKQGLAPAVAVSSGLLNSLAGFIVQFLLVVTGLIVGAGSFDERRGTSGAGVPGWLLPVAAAAATALVIVVVLPGLRRRVLTVATRQLRAAYDNVRQIVANPRKAAALFGGNLVSQVLFALVLGAALEAYGESLPLLQLIIINSLASLLGGVVPVPGGMGVTESGMIAGFTAAGIPQADAVAATFTARMFTTYLPPIWGWVAFNWLRRHDYV